jgi:hypothetical protein
MVIADVIVMSEDGQGKYQVIYKYTNCAAVHLSTRCLKRSHWDRVKRVVCVFVGHHSANMGCIVHDRRKREIGMDLTTLQPESHTDAILCLSCDVKLDDPICHG